MKRFIQCVCLILVLSVFLAIPVTAEEISPWSSRYFMSVSAYIYNVSSTQFQVRFNVTATGMMDELGVNSIEVQRSADNSNWEHVKTYTKEEYENLVVSDTFDHSSYVTCSKASGYSYRAYVEFYAKDSSGTGYYGYYAY